jgi:uncharacterized protein
MKLIFRNLQEHIRNWILHFPAIGIVGPRQVGKTTLVKQIQPFLTKGFVYLDLELSSDTEKLDQPEFFLKQFENKTIIIDEIQRNKLLFPLLRALIDQKRVPGRFILLGSASPELIRDSSESLAGRIIYAELQPVGLIELPGTFPLADLWLKGGFPESLLAVNESIRSLWLNNFVRTYAERDIPLLGLNTNPLQIERLWRILASLHGQLINYTEISKSLGISSNTVKKQIDFLEETFLIRRLYPYSINIQKRLVKAPKVYIRDSGILHHLVNITTFNDLMGHFMSGNSWEGFAIQQIIQTLGDEFQYYFYRTHNGAEVDLLILKGLNIKAAVEIKLSNNASLSKGNYIAIEDLKPEKVFIVTFDSESYYIRENILVCSLKDFLNTSLLHLNSSLNLDPKKTR